MGDRRRVTVRGKVSRNREQDAGIVWSLRPLVVGRRYGFAKKLCDVLSGGARQRSNRYSVAARNDIATRREFLPHAMPLRVE